MIISIVAENPKDSELTQDLDAVVDSGFEGAIIMPRWVAKDLDLNIHSSRLELYDVNGNPVRGTQATVLVSIPDADVSAEVSAFLLDDDEAEVLIGDVYLSDVHAILKIGCEEYPFKVQKKNPPRDPNVWRLRWRGLRPRTDKPKTRARRR